MRGDVGIWRSIGKLTATERRIKTAFPTGAEVDLRTGDADIDDPVGADGWLPVRSVRAEVLAALLLGAGHQIPGRVASLRLRGARIIGPLLLSHGTIGVSWQLQHCRIDGPIELEGTETGSIHLRHTHLRTLSAYNARIRGVLESSDAVIAGGPELALRVGGATIKGDLRARALVTTGPVDLIGTTVDGQVDFSNARLMNPGGRSLHAGGMRVGRSLLCRKMNAVGEVRIPGAEIGSSLNFSGAHLDGAGHTAMSAASLSVVGDVSFRQERSGAGPFFRSEGTLWLPGLRVGGNLYFSGARLNGKGEVALHARRMSVTGSVNPDNGFTTRDEVRLTGAVIGGHLDLTGMTSPDALLTLYTTSVAGGIHDAGDCWPQRVDLDGLVYGPFDPYRPPAERLELMRRQVKADGNRSGGYRAQPYEELAAYYRGLGNDGEARSVLLAKARAARASMPWHGRIGGYLLDLLVGYGFRPSRAIAWAVALLVAGSAYYASVTPSHVSSDDRSVFNPVLYTADQLIPVVRFGEPDVWQFHGVAAVVSVLLTVLGWTLGIAIAAGATRTLSRN